LKQAKMIKMKLILKLVLLYLGGREGGRGGRGGRSGKGIIPEATNATGVEIWIEPVLHAHNSDLRAGGREQRTLVKGARQCETYRGLL
jgi:hypothetical protein